MKDLLVIFRSSFIVNYFNANGGETEESGAFYIIIKTGLEGPFQTGYLFRLISLGHLGRGAGLSRRSAITPQNIGYISLNIEIVT